MDMKIFIFDNNVKKYVNIDRERLRDNSISEERLKEVQKQIINEWCSYLLKNFDSLQQTQEELVSLSLLMYQYVPLNKFKEFYSKLGNKSISNNLKMGKTSLSLQDLLFEENLEIKFYYSLDSTQVDLKLEDETKALFEIIEKLPHSLIKINNIKASVCEDKKGMVITYNFSLNNDECEDLVTMDELSAFLDYFFIIASKNKNDIQFEKLIRCILKPDKDFEKLILSNVPKSFYMRPNFSNILDASIKKFIISPFDQYHKNVLKEYIEGKRDEFKIERNNVHLKKCISYVYKKQDGKYTEKEIEEDFIKMMKKISSSLKENLIKTGYLKEHNQ